ncbi:hypothetical protein ACFL5V_05785 [Fibrobacterota bacterium]
MGNEENQFEARNQLNCEMDVLFSAIERAQHLLNSDTTEVETAALCNGIWYQYCRVKRIIDKVLDQANPGLTEKDNLS